MTLQQQIFSLIASLAVVLFIVDLVRRRRLRVEYSWVWLLTAVAMVAMVIWYRALEWFTRLIGAVLPTTTLFLFAILFLIVINVHYSVAISGLTDKIKALTQHLTLLEHRLAEREGKDTPDPSEAPPPAE